MATQQQIDIEFDSLAHGDDSPKLIANSKATGGTLLSVIKEQLSTCSSFDFCVAFVADGGLQILVEAFQELKQRGIKGRLLTSTYLNFNSPDAFRKLLEYDNFEVRVFQGNLHAKGYIFDKGETSTVIVGSSNMTQTALTCNKEWNVLYQTVENSRLLGELRGEFDSLWNDTSTVALSQEWIEDYAAYRSARPPKPKSKPTFQAIATSASSGHGEIKPNKMQQRALEALGAIHRKGETRALLVSATGTGKTFLSAFDVLATKPRRILFLAHRRRIIDASRASYERLLGNTYTFDTYQTGKNTSNATCVFAMCSSVAKHLSDFRPDEFDYIVIDEAHRTGSQGYQSIMSHFTPRFYLGMTATPNRTDGYDVFALFNHVIAFQITLQDALAEEMLAPFHYFGIHDLEIDDETIEDATLFGRLTSDERVRHITEKIEEYSVNKSGRRGLIFCNRNAEAQELSRKFNELGYRTTAISGQDSDEVRDAAISRLESGELEYIFSVDIMNEGVDIPSLNQIIMLRRTDSAIIFIQQLGRGLRLNDGKEYALVLDFIGNYQSNFLVPIALSGDKTYNKDRLRRLVQEGDSAIPGCSTVSFDRISEARIYKAIDGGNFTSARFLKNEYLDLRQKLGKIPSLLEFDRNGSIDPLLIFISSKSYHDFLSKCEPNYTVQFSSDQTKILRFISQKLAAGKRFEDLYLLRALVEAGHEGYRQMREAALRNYRVQLKDGAIKSAIAVLKGDFATPKDFVSLLIDDETGPRLTEAFATALRNAEFKRQILEVLDFGIARNRLNYAETYENTNFVLNAKYTYEEVCRLMNWEKNINGQNLGGYFYDEKTNTFPVFINYDKAPDISESIQYEDQFVSPSKLIAISKGKRTMKSPEIQHLQAWPGNGLKTYLFMRKNKDDKGGKEFYFLGEMHPTGKFEAIKTKSGDNAVEIEYELNAPVRQDIYEFMLSDLSEAE
ncbi:DUF3427 domain-containing protein [Collinsella aerofaciens]|uniref:DUF3427 domain-containing protein n=1 Tax=Collinsella aerofaciens TaxID=74426 RepID=UPI0034A34BE9